MEIPTEGDVGRKYREITPRRLEFGTSGPHEGDARTEGEVVTRSVGQDDVGLDATDKVNTLVAKFGGRVSKDDLVLIMKELTQEDTMEGIMDEIQLGEETPTEGIKGIEKLS